MGSSNIKNTYFISILIGLCVTAQADEYVNKVNEDNTKAITDLDFSDLMKVKVTSVGKKAQALSDAPSAIFVISNEDIRRSGVTSIPEALRLAPGLDIARINSNKWAISSRGFNGSSANKLLVLIDGRSVYTPVFSGVYWDAQDTLLEDVDRIEVIRGPGAALWGSNAVNGVINIITKQAKKTEGGLITGGGGNLEKGFGSFRYGRKLTDETYGRFYVKGFNRDHFDMAQNSVKPNDQWDKVQGGFKVDSMLSSQDELTVQGDLYHTNFNQAIAVPALNAPYQKLVNDTAMNEGWNLTSKYTHQFDSQSQYSLQFYYDHTKRNEFFEGHELDTLDLDFQHNFSFDNHNNLLWGLGYRVNMDNFQVSEVGDISPKSRHTQLFTAFIQDEAMLIDNKLWLTIGSKFEHNDYTGFEGQPSAKLMWAPSPMQRLWASVSRSVRIPNRAENDLTLTRVVLPSSMTGAPLPLKATVNGNRSFQAEVQLAYEIGYRFALSNKSSLDLTAFYNDYDKLRYAQPGFPTIAGTSPNLFMSQPSFFTNATKGNTYGLEVAGVWQMSDWWRWDINYSYLHTHYDSPTPDSDPISPQNKASLRALINPIETVDLDFWFRYNSSAKLFVPYMIGTIVPPHLGRVKGYVTLDARVAWRPYRGVELSLVGQNLLADHHMEYCDEAFVVPSEVPRSFYGKVSLEF